MRETNANTTAPSAHNRRTLDADARPRRSLAPRLVATIAGCVGAWATTAIARRVLRDARAYRRASARLRDVYADVGGERLRARVAQPRRLGRAHHLPLVLVHGFGVSSAYWVPLAADLATDCAVYVLDLPGHGPARTPRATPTVAALAESVVGWLDALGLSRVALVGNSLGCQTVAEVAVRYPERVSALVLIGPTVDPAARDGWRQAARLAASAPFEPLWLDAIVVGDYLRAGPRLLIGELQAMLAHRIETLLPRVIAPTLVVRGEHDHIVPRRWAVEAGRLAGADAVLEVTGAGHAVHFDAPDVVAAAIRRFLARVAGRHAVGRRVAAHG